MGQSTLRCGYKVAPVGRELVSSPTFNVKIPDLPDTYFYVVNIGGRVLNLISIKSYK
jgi:hypothetical protein